MAGGVSLSGFWDWLITSFILAGNSVVIAAPVCQGMRRIIRLNGTSNQEANCGRAPRSPLYGVTQWTADTYPESDDSIPHAYLWILPNAGHVPIFGSVAPLFTKTVLEFLGGTWERSVRRFWLFCSCFTHPGNISPAGRVAPASPPEGPPCRK